MLNCADKIILLTNKRCDITVFYWLVFASSRPMGIFGTHEKVAIPIPTVTCTLPIPNPIFGTFVFPFPWDFHGNPMGMGIPFPCTSLSQTWCIIVLQLQQTTCLFSFSGLWSMFLSGYFLCTAVTVVSCIFVHCHAKGYWDKKNYVDSSWHNALTSDVSVRSYCCSLHLVLQLRNHYDLQCTELGSIWQRVIGIAVLTAGMVNTKEVVACRYCCCCQWSSVWFSIGLRHVRVDTEGNKVAFRDSVRWIRISSFGQYQFKTTHSQDEEWKTVILSQNEASQTDVHLFCRRSSITRWMQPK